MKKVKTILKDKTGASLVFVLGVMLLLLAIGTSALVAATAGAGSMKSKRELNQLNLYADSMQKAILYSLQTSNKDEDKAVSEVISSLTTLGGYVIEAMYNNDSPVELELSDIKLGGDDIGEITSVSITTEHFKNVTAEVPSVDEVRNEKDEVIIEGIPWQPGSATIDGSIFVTLLAEVEGKTVKTITEYSFSGVSLGQPSPGRGMNITNAGRWEVVSYDKLSQ